MYVETKKIIVIFVGNDHFCLICYKYNRLKIKNMDYISKKKKVLTYYKQHQFIHLIYIIHKLRTMTRILMFKNK